jgi:hypothetical protein
MTEPQIRYDEPSDTLYVSAFGPTASETIPITVLRPGMTAPRAA